MDLFDVLKMIGGLAMFLFGMNLMGDALAKKAGTRLREILGKMTSSLFKGVLLGTIVTVIIQSSSATTVMVVGFVNSGLMTLHQAVGVIFGANIGATITPWILSLTGIQGENLFIQMLNPNSFTPILAAIGVVLYVFMKSPKQKDTGLILLGFSVLIFGMASMSASVYGLKESPEFQNILLMFENPLLGLFAGLILTVIIQSSSASIGILQALSITGKITFGNAIPMIVGMNIGTCITALLSSIGSGRDAKRAACIHLYYNVVGATIGLSLFYLLNLFVQFSFLSNPTNHMSIAVVNTLFNVVEAVSLLPLNRVVERMACATVKEEKVNDGLSLLDERLLDTPSVALVQSKQATVAMAEMSIHSLHQSMTLLKQYDAKVGQKILEDEDMVDQYEDKIGSYLVRLNGYNLSEDENLEVAKLLHMIGDFERISDHAASILHSAEEMHDKQAVFSPNAQKELTVLMQAVEEVSNLALKAFVENDLQTAMLVEPLEEVVDSLRWQLRTRHIIRLQKNECTIEYGFILSDLLTNLERVSDHCSNIAVCILEIAQSKMEMHDYMSHFKNGGEFSEKHAEFCQKYTLVDVE